MFERLKKSKLDGQIDEVLLKMQELGPDDEDYPNMMTNLERLVTLKAEEAKSGFSQDTFLIVGGNLLGILIIVAYEQKHVMVSKALNFLNRVR